jgi:hypothetical protein
MLCLGQLAEWFFSIVLLDLLCFALDPSVCSHTLQGCPGFRVGLFKGTMFRRNRINGDASQM